MSFYISLSGLKGAQADLSAISNNVANVNSTAFKKSKAQFGDIFAAAPMQTTRQVSGQGVRVQGITQQFTQGTIETTDKTLDLAITGEGFFAVKGDQGNLSYTRNGAFSVDNDRYAVDTTGSRLQVFPVNSTTGKPGTQAGDPLDLSINGSGYFQVKLADGTTAYTRTGNFEVRADGAIVNGDGLPIEPPITAEPGVTDISVSANGTVRAGGAEIGQIHIAAFVNPEGLQPVDNAGNEVASGSLMIATPVSGAPVTETDDLPGLGGRGTIQSGGGTSSTAQTAASLQDLQIPTQDAQGNQLTSVGISKEGLVSAVYSDGSTVYLGQIAMASFNSLEGLRQQGDAHWTNTVESGAPIFGTANSGMFGSVNSGSLERSNVDITEELVNLISAQRNFQANAKAIEAANTLTTTIVNMRS